MDNKSQQPTNLNLPQPVSEAPLPIAQENAVAPTPALQPSHQQPAPVAQDADTIEPGWVRAVEALRRQYIDDPRRLSTELANLRTRYLKERYGKEIKAAEGQGQ